MAPTANPYGGPWPKVRHAILERDTHTCQIQGPKCTTEATDVDHIIPWQEGGAWYDPDNLRAACAKCNRSRGPRRMAAMARINVQAATTPSRDW
jgi:5-methylcytosine-specific restriction endonuclease McrA